MPFNYTDFQCCRWFLFRIVFFSFFPNVRTNSSKYWNCSHWPDTQSEFRSIFVYFLAFRLDRNIFYLCLTWNKQKKKTIFCSFFYYFYYYYYCYHITNSEMFSLTVTPNSPSRFSFYFSFFRSSIFTWTFLYTLFISFSFVSIFFADVVISLVHNRER